MNDKKNLEGFKDIASVLENIWGIDISQERAGRYAILTSDPLPCWYVMGRVVAIREEVVEWATRQIQTRRKKSSH